MKTTDLIPLILHELSDGDKYGFELSKSIELRSNGKIVIKQATLYTILKKLEKSKFISSYWQDSEIGGKRHYYKLTENGNSQLSTMPSVSVIIDKILKDGVDDVNLAEEPAPTKKDEIAFSEQKQINFEEEPKPVSIMDLLLEQQEEPKLKESVLPTDEVFASQNIDNLTESEINSSNAELLKNGQDVKTEQFASNKNVAKFTESEASTLSQSYKSQIEEKTKSQPAQPIKIQQPIVVESDGIKYVDYVNFKHSQKYLTAKKIARNMWLRVICSTAYLIVMSIISAIVKHFVGGGVIYNVALILALMVIVFYPTIYAVNYDKFCMHLKEAKFKYDYKKHLIISLSITLVMIVVVIISNVALGGNSISKLFGIKNFANIYAPILMLSTIMIDYLFLRIFIRKNKN